MRNPVGKTSWLTVRITAIVLVVLLIIHIGVQHFSLTINESGVVMALLLIFALIHGAIGTRRIILDFRDYSRNFEKIVTLAMIFIILVFVIIGLIVLPNNI